jgi:uncharacterized protein YihD (DUF1040 family)
MVTLSWIAYGLFLWFIGASNSFNSFGIMKVAFSTSRLYLLLILVTGANFIIDLCTYSYSTIFMKNLTQLLRILVKEKGKLNDETQLTDDILVYNEMYKFAVNDGAFNENKSKKKLKANTKNLEKVDRVNVGDLDSISSQRDEEEVKIKDKHK